MPHGTPPRSPAAAAAAPDVTLLINNAGVATDLGASLLDPAIVANCQHEWQVNVQGTLLVTQELAPILAPYATDPKAVAASGTELDAAHSAQDGPRWLEADVDVLGDADKIARVLGDQDEPVLAAGQGEQHVVAERLAHAGELEALALDQRAKHRPGLAPRRGRRGVDAAPVGKDVNQMSIE